MFKVTVKGLRGHLTRFVSTFVAILLGVGFLAGSTLGKKPDRGRRPRVRF